MSRLADAMLAWKAKLTTKVTPEQVLTLRSDVNVFVDGVQFLESDNAKLRERMEQLVTLLRVDCDIEASWDGLRKFWSISLTKDGCLMRDRACKAEAENVKLRELCTDLWNRLRDEDEHCGECRSSCEYDAWNFGSPKCIYSKRMRELGIEMD